MMNILILCLAACAAWAQVPVGKMPSSPLLYKGATIHTGTGEVIENGFLAVKDGKITQVGSLDSGAPETAGHQVIDVSGKHLYPGLIMPSIDLGLVEVGAIRATNDSSERGEINPNIRTLTSFNTDSELIPTYRFNGILLAQIAPGGGQVSGTSSVVALEGYNWEQAAYKTDDGIHMEWPSRSELSFDWSTFTRSWQENEDYDAQYHRLEKLFADAKAFLAARDKKPNLKLEAMAGLFDGSKTLYIRARQSRSIVESVKKTREWGVKRIVISSGTAALEVADFLAEQKVPVIVGSLHSLPSTQDSDVNEIYKLPARLKEKGVQFCLGYGSRMNARNLPFLAGSAAAWGLSKEEALASVTSETAKILGIDDMTGSLAVGKDANLFVSEGDALDMRTNQLTEVLIRGKQVPLEAMQQRLYERYKTRYGQ